MAADFPLRLKRPRALRDPLVWMIVLHWGLGALIGALAAGLVLAFDIAHLRSLLVRSDAEWTGIVMLFTGFAVTFGGVVSATAVMFNPGRARD